MDEDTHENGPRNAPAPQREAEAPVLDLGAIRRTLQRGDPVFPGLILELVDRLEQAEGRMQALLALGDGSVTRQMIVATLLMPRNTNDLDAYVGTVHALLRLAVQGAAARAETEMTSLQCRIDKLTADVGAWWWIVNDLHMLGCLDCSNNACDRARAALVAAHPGKSLHALVIAARAWRDAVGRMDGVHTAEQVLLEAIKGCDL